MYHILLVYNRFCPHFMKIIYKIFLVVVKYFLILCFFLNQLKLKGKKIVGKSFMQIFFRQ